MSVNYFQNAKKADYASDLSIMCAHTAQNKEAFQFFVVNSLSINHLRKKR